MATSAKAVRRSTTFKQFLLRVHPDHFRAIPKVHDENLQSIQLLNQFMDDQRGSSPSFHHPHHHSGQRKRIFFSAYVPTTFAGLNDDGQVKKQQLKRFRLDLATNIEDHMQRILRECGIEIAATESSDSPFSSSSSSARDRDAWDKDSGRYGASSTARGGMDYGFNAHFAQYAHTRRRKRSILTLAQFFAYMDEPETHAKQQQVGHAFESIQSVTRTLMREFGLRQVATSCGWASVPLNATLLSLVKTLRKIRHSVQLDGVCLDVRADASEIDYFDEYTVVLNVADVPLQWVEVLEKVDAELLASIHAAHASLTQLQLDAERALRGGPSVTRGRTCSALAYRGFLQDMAATAPLFAEDPMRADFRKNDAVVEKVSIVVEDSVRECEILDDGTVRAPSCASATEVLEFMDTHRSAIREQLMEFATQRQQFEIVAQLCVDVLGLASLTYAPGLRLRDVNRASAKLLAFASDGQRYGSATANELAAVTRSKALRFDRYFGLAQDGVFTLPTEWIK